MKKVSISLLSFLAVFLFDPNGIAQDQLVKSPLPPDETELAYPETQDEFDFKVEYLIGHAMPVVYQLGATIEAMAYVESCNSNPMDLPAGTVVIEQFSYPVELQEGESELLECKQMPISKRWIEVFNLAARQCLDRSAERISWPRPVSAILKSLIIYAHKGNDKRLSLHAAARAVDIHEITLIYPNQLRTIDVSLAGLASSPEGKRATKERQFLTEFRSCWSEILVQEEQCHSWSNRERGSIAWEHPDHQNHLHLSLPYCPGNPAFYGG